MTTFLRLMELDVEAKAARLKECLHSLNMVDDLREHNASIHACIFDCDPVTFAQLPGSPFAYWVGSRVRTTFIRFERFEADKRTVKQGLATADDFRFLRAWWEVDSRSIEHRWRSFAKGGIFSPFYADVPLVLDWLLDGAILKAKVVAEHGNIGKRIYNEDYYLRPGLTWPRRTNGLSFRAMPSGCIFADKGPAAFVQGDESLHLLAASGLLNSRPFGYLVSVQLARTELAQSYEVGIIQQTPVPELSGITGRVLSSLARRAWSLKRTLDTTNETSHAFLLPTSLRPSLGTFESVAIQRHLDSIQKDIDDQAFRLYGLEGEDRAEIERWAAKRGKSSGQGDNRSDDDDESESIEAYDEESEAQSAGDRDTLLSWCVGVAFGRFDIRLATGERSAPPEPEPFDPLPQRSPGMMQDDSAVRSILTDDEGHADDLTAAVRDVLTRVQVPEPEGLRAWLARDFFPLHIQMYSKSRRKAPIYWQLATPSASYSVWLYIHAFSKDTLYKVQNDHVATKLAHEERKLESLRADLGAAPKAADRKLLAAQESLVDELRAFLEEVKRVAPLWNPDLDDGVILNFAPLWRLVPHHKPWQKELKTTWEALASGAYDWAHLAMHLWPERVVPKCATDRSLAIAHDLEDVFWEEGPDGKWKPRPAPTRSIDDLVHDRTSPAVKAALKSLTEAPTAAGTAKRTRKGKAHA